MKKYEDLKLLYYNEALVLSTTAEEVKNQLIANFGKDVSDKLINQEFKDEFDMRRYAIYLSNSGNQLILATTGCSKEDYDENPENLPKIDEVVESLSEECEDVDSYFPICAFDKVTIFAYKWFNSQSEYTIMEESEYDDLVNENYHQIIAKIESRL